ncbi:MAG: hypothetical protein ABIH50_06935, partial [bacterium]
MGMTATTMAGFREQMTGSIKNWYRGRGLSGSGLFQYAERLDTMAKKMKAGGKNTDEIKKALAREQAHLLEYPGKFDPSAIVEDGNYIVAGNDYAARIQEHITNALKNLLNGLVQRECHYAGLGTRLELNEPKFTLTAEKLLNKLTEFASRIVQPGYENNTTYITLDKQINAEGGIDAISATYGNLSNLTIGERIFSAKLFSIYQLAKKIFTVTDDAFKDIVAGQKFKVIINQDSGAPIIEAFIRNKFFGLDPKKVIFMYQVKHPTQAVGEKGELEPDTERTSQGNHGLIAFQSVLEERWFRFIPLDKGGYMEERLTPTDYADWQSASAIELIENVEDTAQYVHPHNLAYLGAIEKGRGADKQFAMKMVNNKADN